MPDRDPAYVTMNETEKQLLENVFDALDRIFDRESKIIDLYALMYATEKALGESFADIQLNEYIEKLFKVIRSGESEEIQREDALVITDRLRHELNELLPL